MSEAFPYHIYPLGDSALTIEFGNRIDEALNREVLRRCRQLQSGGLPGIIEVVPAYSSVTLFYDPAALYKIVPPGKMIFDWVSEKAAGILAEEWPQEIRGERLTRIPVCYDPSLAPDLLPLAAARQLSPDEVIRLHSGPVYRVYMLGFMPGFSYMGIVDEQLATPRKPQPVPVEAGSVAIAGRQTGIYPLASPGGWHVIGRTPLKLFDKALEDPVLLHPGDSVQFISISKDEFENY